ncbi:MAG: mercuric reductase, partial [Pirellulaceae bacterium]|nr:mercuric reductase [Pirellulaceae bacterium]
RSARAAAAVRDAERLAVHVPGSPAVDFAAVMERMRRLRADISPHDSAARFRELGVDVFLGAGRFASPDSVEVDGARLRFARAVIATGGRPAAPPIPGLDQVPYLTNETIFSLTELPRRLAVIGAGPIGCELAQAMARFGAEVFLIEATHGILPREDRAAADLVQQSLLRDGVRLLCCGKQTRIERAGDGGARIRLQSHDQQYDLSVDAVLVAAGRAPNVEGLNLEVAGVEYDLRQGVRVDDKLRTTNRRIFAAGDICSQYKFTHAADFLARTAIQNALFLPRARVSSLLIPWCTYTSPEVAHVGLTADEVAERGDRVRTFVQELARVDRAILDDETEGFVKVHLARGSDRILGATIVAANAGDLIAEVTLAMTHRLGLKKIGATIHPYPTQAEALRKLGDAYNRTRLTPLVQSLLRRWLAWRRG